MINNSINTDIFKTENKHIAFAVNKEGFNDSGFAGQVSSQYWPELANCGEHEIGTVLSKTCGDKTFHAIVCHSLHEGWGENQSEVIRDCFDKIESNGETISTIAIGTGLIGILGGAKFRQVLCGMHESKNNIVLHSRYTLDSIMNTIAEEKENYSRRREY